MLVPTWTWPSQVSARTTDCLTDMFWESTCIVPYNTTKAQSSCLQQSDKGWIETFARLTDWMHFCLLIKENLLRGFHLVTQQTSKMHTWNYARVFYVQLSNASHVAVARTTCHVGTKSARPFIAISSQTSWGLTDSNRAALALLSQVNQKKQEQWEGRSCEFHWLRALQSPGVEHIQY